MFIIGGLSGIMHASPPADSTRAMTAETSSASASGFMTTTTSLSVVGAGRVDP